MSLREAVAEALREATKQMGVEVSEEQVRQCALFAELVAEGSKQLNLTTVTEPVEMAIKHFVDSFTCLKMGVWPAAGRAVDVGTGAGFPGVALAILRPDMEWVLVDALRKRIDFLQAALLEVGLRGIRCVHSRAEQIGRDREFRGYFDVAVARAVAPLPVLLEYCLPLVRVGGGFLAMKGPDVREELMEGVNAAQKLGADKAETKELELPGGSGGQNA